MGRKTRRLREEIGERITGLRGERGWTQRELAGLLGISVLKLSKWETGEHAPTLIAMRRLAEVLEVDVCYLYGECRGDYSSPQERAVKDSPGAADLPRPSRARPQCIPSAPKTQARAQNRGKTVRLTVDLPADLVERTRSLVYWSPDLTLSGVLCDGLAAHLEELESSRGAAPRERGRLKTRRPRL